MSVQTLEEIRVQELRKETRYPITGRLEVYDCNSELHMGHVADLSNDGFMLLSNIPLKLNTIFQLRVNLPGEIEGLNHIIIGADSLWSKASGGGRQFWTGFQLLDIDEDSRRIMQIVMQQS